MLIPPNMIQSMKDFLYDESIKYEVTIYDIQKAINYENPKLSMIEKLEIHQTHGHPLTWYRYHDYDDIILFMEYQHRKYPLNVELIHIGRSFEGRPLVIVKIFNFENETSNKKMKNHKKVSYKTKLKKNRKPAIFIECGAHGREWISPAVCTWIINRLVDDIIKNSTESEIFGQVDWFILPVLNPDGYQYSRKYDRLWQKTRSKHDVKENFGIIKNALSWMNNFNSKQENNCFGTDPNRNWNFNWNGVGSSHSKCSDSYIGPYAESEPEVKGVSKFLTDNRKHIQVYLLINKISYYFLIVCVKC